MSDQNNPGLRKIRRALISVSDKAGIVDFARELKRFDVEIISTGGTAGALREAGIEITDVSQVTGFPEMMDGRIKTLHPKIHGALLALRDNENHLDAMREHAIGPIDLVVVNLYPFEQTILREGVTIEEAIEQIDIGGPAMIRSAAKNYRDVAVVVSPLSYPDLVDELVRNDGSLSRLTRTTLAISAFQRTQTYDASVFSYLNSSYGQEIWEHLVAGNETRPVMNLDSMFRQDLQLRAEKKTDLRYGENPHQKAALYISNSRTGVANAELLSGKEMSFNNYVDADAAWQLACDFEELACAIIKHTNPAGVALGGTSEEAYRRALACDPVSAFGGIVAFNRVIDKAAASAVVEIFTEVVIAPDYDEAALDLLAAKKNLRILRSVDANAAAGFEYRQISGGMLAQTRDEHRLNRAELKVVSKRAPSEKELDDLLFAWTVCKHTKSNAIVYARDRQTVGVGAGQMSRVDSVKIAAMRAQLPLAGAVMASDAFFPFRDGVDEAAQHGITAVIQPGGSMRDEEVINAADEHNLAMVLTGVRHFKH
jgi:phosphoribosylaminoimidazolecarboxamide formyltransferase/IMP cyclohydrolase